MEFEKPKLRIVLLQQHEVLREGLEILLEREPEFSVVGSFDDPGEALADVPRLKPDLILAGWEFNGSPVKEFLDATQRLAPTCKRLVLSTIKSVDSVREALRAGADGFIDMFAGVPELIHAIRTVCAGRQFICNTTATRILSAHFSDTRAGSVQTTSQPITGREREVLTRIALGNSNKAIARELGVSPKTVEKHRSNLMRKLQLHNAAAITMYAIRNGMTGGDTFGMSGALARTAAG